VDLHRQNAVERAVADLGRAGLSERCEVIGGDFFGTIPVRADAYFLRHIIHDWDDDRPGSRPERPVDRPCLGHFTSGVGSIPIQDSPRNAWAIVSTILSPMTGQVSASPGQSGVSIPRSPESVNMLINTRHRETPMAQKPRRSTPP
jgi:hypothetical protein